MPVKDAEDTRSKISIILLLIGTIFQTAEVLKREEWLECALRINQLLEIVDNPQFRETLKVANAYDPTKDQQESEEEDETLPAGTTTKKVNDYEVERSVFPSLSNFLEKLDDQIYKSYQKSHHSSLEYLQRINDENELLFLIDKVSAFLQEFELDMLRSRIAIIKL